jgi:hypothetical protein
MSTTTGNARVSSRVRREPWTLDQWRAFGRRCQGVRRRLDDLIRHFPETRGLTSGHVNGMVKLAEAWHAAMVSAETPFEGQHPEHCISTLGIIHGENGGGAVSWGPCRGRVKRDAPALSRERWAELGAEFKAIRREMMALSIDLGGAIGPRRIARFDAAERRLDKVRCALDGLVYRQHPDWREFARAFYGDRDPTPAEAIPT